VASFLSHLVYAKHERRSQVKGQMAIKVKVAENTTHHFSYRDRIGRFFL